MKKKFIGSNNYKVDFVVAWVDGSDNNWIKKKNFYSEDHNKTDDFSRFRDWGLFRYWFRSVEANAPWVNTIYLVVDEQIPCFLNTSHPKLKIINHKDYLPDQYLPTFNSNAIEINFHRIQGLSEHFVYFNDDMFLNKKLSKSFFFKHSLPRYTYIERKINSNSSFMSKIVYNDMRIVNDNIKRSKKISFLCKILNYRYGKHLIKNIKYVYKSSFESFEDNHLPCPFLQSTFDEIWEKEFDICDLTSRCKFRKDSNINQYVFKYYDLARGKFYPQWVRHRGYYLLSKETIKSSIKDIKKGCSPMICLNDNSDIDYSDYSYLKEQLIKAFEIRYPKKSSFEK